MPRNWPRHFVIRPSGIYFQATPAMKRAGIFSEALGKEIATTGARPAVTAPALCGRLELPGLGWGPQRLASINAVFG